MKVDVFVLDYVFSTYILLKSCPERQNLLEVAIEPQKVAPNTKICSKVVEHNQKRPIRRPPDYLTKQSDFRRVY